MKRKPPLLGLCPIGKFVFSNEDAVRQKTRLQGKLREWDVQFVDLDARARHVLHTHCQEGRLKRQECGGGTIAPGMPSYPIQNADARRGAAPPFTPGGGEERILQTP